MDPMLIPFVVAFSAAAFVAWGMLKDGKGDKGLAVGAAIAIFIVSISITHTIVFFSFSEILKLLTIGAIPAGLIAGVALFGKDSIGDKVRLAVAIFGVLMFLWFVVIGFVAGGNGDFNDCHDAGPQGMYTVCE